MTPTHREDCRVIDPATGSAESYGFLGVDADQVYVARHHAVGEPRAAVVLSGPIGAERERAYRTLVQLARSLAVAGFETLRFDYRGIGESTGAFEEMSFTGWRRDVEACIQHMTAELPGTPLALWGVRAGALLACECFRAGMGDAAMLAAPMGARDLLQDILRRSLIGEMIANPQAPRTTRDACMARLQDNELVNVDGYFWSPRLWTDAERFPLTLPQPDEDRPWRVLDFKGLPAAQLPAWAEPHRETNQEERFWESSGPLVPRTPSLYDRTIAWVETLCVRGG